METTAVAPKTPTAEVKRSEDDPRKFIEEFRNSSRYKAAYDTFYQGKTFSPDVTEQEKRERFESDEAAKQAFFNFAEHDISFHYNSANYPPEAQKAIEEYLAMAKDRLKMLRQGGTQDQILSLDRMQNTYHQAAASVLVEKGVVPTPKIGKTMVSLISIEKGLESFGKAKEPDIKRIERVLGGVR